MTTAAKAAFGTKLYRGGGGAAGQPRTGGTLIEEITETELPEKACDAIDVTSHDSAAAEFINSYPDEGEISVEMNYTGATGQEALRGDLGGAAVAYYINLAGGGGQKQLAFSALVRSWKFGAGRKGQVTASARLKITGLANIYTQ